jgi:hypothetical protein
MSSLITKANKSRSSASNKIHAIKGKKAASRKPARPGKITAAPKAQKVSKNKKAAAAKKRPEAKKSKQAVSVKKPASRLAPVAKELTPKKPAAKTAASKGKPTVAASHPTKKVAKVAKVASGKPVLSGAKAKSRRALLARRRAFAPKPLPAPPKKPPSPGTLAAVRAFEQALRVFNRQDFVAAKSAFHSLLDKFGDQADIVARVRTYLAVCDQRLARTPSTPRNSDALYDRGVFEFNRGNTAEAIESFEKALKVEPRADHVFYSLAAAYARLNNVAKALEALRHAIGIRPAHRSHARRDLDFAGLRSDESFQQLTGFGFDLVHE